MPPTFNSQRQCNLMDSETAYKWMGGVVVPGVTVVSAVWSLLDGRMVLRNRNGGGLELAGFDAVLLFLALVSLAVFLHAQHFWTREERLSAYAALPQTGGLVVFVVAIGWLAVRQFANFI